MNHLEAFAAKLDSDSSVLKSKIKYDSPPEGANMARMLWEAFERHSSRTLLVDGGSQAREFTGLQLRQSVGCIARNLIDKVGIKTTGQVALLFCDHNSDEILLALGLVLAGCGIYGSNPEDGYNEEKLLAKLVKPDVIIYQSQLHSNVLKIIENEQLQDVKLVWIDNPLKRQKVPRQNGLSHSDGNRTNGLDRYRESLERDKVFLFEDLLDNDMYNQDFKVVEERIYRRIKPETEALTYMMTSGSTDKPKVVKSTHEELVHGMYSMISASKYALPNAEGQTRDKSKLLLPIEPDSVFAGDLPLDHGAGINTMFLSMHTGSKFVIMPAYKEDAFWQTVHEHRITSSIASTTFTFRLLTRLKELIDSGEHSKWDLSSLKWINCCGSKMAFVDLIKEINKHYPSMSICQCYGATEMGFMAMLAPSNCINNIQSVGHLFPGMYAKIVNPETGEPCRANEKGQLHVWSRSKFKQYMCHPDDDPEHMIARCHDKCGFYITGDQVHCDEQGMFYIHGRLKDTLYLMQDIKILPAELEDVINEHPLVESSAVVGVPDPELPGCDAPRAFIKLIAPSSVEFDSLEASARDKDLLRQSLLGRDLDFIAGHVYTYAASRTAKPKHLKGGVRILDEFPRVGLMNKVDRKVLRQMQ